MKIGANLVLIWIGAVLALATDASISGVDLTVVGVSLVGLGSIGLLIALLVWDAPQQIRPPERSYAESTAPPGRVG
jgi:hypothetical protein